MRVAAISATSIALVFCNVLSAQAVKSDSSVTSDSALVAERTARQRSDSVARVLQNENDVLKNIVRTTQQENRDNRRSIAPTDIVVRAAAASDGSFAVAYQMVGKPGFARLEVRKKGEANLVASSVSREVAFQSTVCVDGLAPGQRYTATLTAIDMLSSPTSKVKHGRDGEEGYEPKLAFETRQTSDIGAVVAATLCSREIRVEVTTKVPTLARLVLYKKDANGALQVPVYDNAPFAPRLDELGLPQVGSLAKQHSFTVAGLESDTDYSYDLELMTEYAAVVTPRKTVLVRTSKTPTELAFISPLQTTLTLGAGLRVEASTSVDVDTARLVVDFGSSATGEREEIKLTAHPTQGSKRVSFFVPLEKLLTSSRATNGKPPTITLSASALNPETRENVTRSLIFSLTVVVPGSGDTGVSSGAKPALEKVRDVMADPEKAKKMKWTDWVALGLGALVQVIP